MLSLVNQAAGVNVAHFLSCGINSVVLGVQWRSYNRSKCERNSLYAALNGKTPKKLLTALQTLDSAIGVHF